MFSRIPEVIAICLPVFTLIALGAVLRARGKMNDEQQNFLAWLVNTYSLPALVFLAVSKEDFATLINIPVLSATLGTTALFILLGAVLVKIFKPSRDLAAPMIFTTYWSNLTFLGFPLAESAFGYKGATVAAIVNAFTIPTFIVSGIVAMHLTRRDDSRENAVWLLEALAKAFTNPIVAATLLGAFCAWLFHLPFFRQLGTYEPVYHLVGISQKTLELTARLGLPAALICVGYGLRWHAVREHRMLLAWTVSAKLLFAPLLTLGVLSLFGPLPEADVGVAVMLMATPGAVASYVISRQMGVDGPFVAATLTMSTLGCCITLPLWVWFVLP